jgi:hypothetical protein
MCCKKTEGAQALLGEAHRNLDNALTAVTRLQEELTRLGVAPDRLAEVNETVNLARIHLSTVHSELASKKLVH